VKKITPRRTSLLGSGLMAAILGAGSAEARAQEAPAEVQESSPRARFDGGPLDDQAAASRATVESVLVCSSLPRTPKEPCHQLVGVKVGFDALPFLDMREHTAEEMALTRSLERGARTASRRRFAALRPAMLYGIEPEPILQFQLKREMLVLLAKVTDEARILRAATSIEPTSSIRAVAESQNLDRTRARATYVEIEGLMGDTPRATTLTAQFAYASAGAALFAGGILGEKLLHGALEDTFCIHPQPWPPGIRISGTFGSP
jgi:hypothetical protein